MIKVAKISYWNQDNFEGLELLISCLNTHPDYHLFAQYCVYRSKGLRQQAFKTLGDFIKYCLKQSKLKQLHITLEMLGWMVNMREVHQLMTYPLSQFFSRVLGEEKKNQSKDSVIYQWLGYLHHDIEMYHYAYDLDQNNQSVIQALSQFYLDQVDWQTHHLNESLFIGEIEQAYFTLAQAHFYLQQLQSNLVKEKLLKAYTRYHNLIDAWQSYCTTQSKESFIKWCAERQIMLSPNTIIYYSW